MIQWVAEQGWSGYFYDGFNFLGRIAAVLFSLLFSCKFDIPRHKALGASLLWHGLFTVIFSLYLVLEGMIFLPLDLDNYTDSIKPLIFAPAILIPICKLFKLELRRGFDLFWINFPIMVAFFRCGCAFAGCCHGYASDFGIYNPQYRVTCFPVQYLDGIVLIFITVLLLRRSKDNAWQVDGLNFPLFFMLHGITRFFTEFLHDDNKVIWGLSEISFYSIAVFAVGVVWYILAKRYNARLARREEQGRAVFAPAEPLSGGVG